MAIGAHENDGNGSNSGHVRVYNYSGGSWTQLGSDIDGEAAEDYSGDAVSLSSDGSRVAIGAKYNDGNGNLSGHVRVYNYNGGSWAQLGSDIDGEAAGDELGYSVSLSSDGNRVAIAAPFNDGNGDRSGHVRVYNYSGESWTQLGSDIDGEAADDQSGWSVSLSSDGSRVAIGALNNDSNGSNSGHVRVYNYSGTAWMQLGSDIDGEAADDFSGMSVSLSSDGSRVAIGAQYNDGNGSNSGHIRVYNYSSGSWTQLGSDIDGEAAGDFSGNSVSLSSDGSRVAIGAQYNDGNGTDAGHVSVFEFSSGNWTQLGADIDGEAAYDNSGWSVSLSSDGSRVAIGARRNDGNADYSRHVRIYSVNTIPTVSSISDILTNSTSNQTVNLTGTDTDTEIIAFTATSSNTSVVTVTDPTDEALSGNNTTAMLTLTYVGEGTSTITVTATDPNSATGTASFTYTNDQTAPATPTDLTATPGNQQVTLRWSPNTESDLHKYNIYRDTSSPAITLIDSVVATSPPDTFYTDTGLTNGQTYYYRITAVDSAVNGSVYSDEVNATPYGGPVWHIAADGSDTDNGSSETPFATIQHGINVSSNGDSVVVQSGTYVENINFNGKNIVVGSLFLTTNDTSYISQTVIDGNQSGSVVTFDNGEDTTAILNGLVITGGVASLAGGGISCSNNSSPTLVNLNIIENSSVWHGGGVGMLSGSEPSLENVTISNNSALGGDGGGIYCGGGSNLSLENVVIESNNASNSGGGIHSRQNSNLSLYNVTLKDNSSNGEGGGIYFTGSSFSTLENVTISGNSSGSDGGGISCYSSSLNLNKVTITGNSASLIGGGLMCYNTQADIVNTIISDNAGNYGIYVHHDNSDINISWSDLWNNEGGNYAQFEGTLSLNSCIEDDPLYVDPVNGDFHLQWGSPCIDAGDPDLDGDGTTWESDPDDQDPDGTRMDMGAYYFDQTDSTPPTVSITSLSSSNVGTNDEITVEWEAIDNWGLDSAFVDILYSNETLIRVNATLVETGQSTIAVPDSTLDSFQLIVTVWDFGHNEAKDTSEVITVYDNTPPEITVNSPQEGYSVPEYGKITVTWNATDNIEMDSVRIYFSNDGGEAFTNMGSQPADSIQFSFEIPAGVTDSAQIKLIAMDIYSNTGEDFSSLFTVTDNTPPTATLLTPDIGTELEIGSIAEITWTAYDNVEVTSIDLRYSANNGQSWSDIMLDEPNDGSYSWLIPNEPSNEVKIQLIAYDGVGLSDTSEVVGLSIVIAYPVVISVNPSPGKLTWRDNSLELTFSQRMLGLDNEGIEMSSGFSASVTDQASFDYTNETNSLVIGFPTSLASMDTITFTLNSETVTNIYGYPLDGNGDGEGGDDYIFQYSTTLLADYDTTSTIDVIDLAQFVQGLEEDDYYYELGPVSGSVPYFISTLDSVYNIEDVMAFVMMWNWYMTSSGSQFMVWSQIGQAVDFVATPDSIFIEIPDASMAYEVQIKYKPGSFSIGTISQEAELKLMTNDEAEGIYTYVSKPESNRLAIPIAISGKEARVSISFRAVGYNGIILSQLTKDLTIANIPEEFALHQNYPNPFNPVTVIEYDLPVDAYVNLVIYDILGRQVITLVNGIQKSGYKKVRWNGTNDKGKQVGAGMYLYRIEAGRYTKTYKMVLLK